MIGHGRTKCGLGTTVHCQKIQTTLEEIAHQLVPIMVKVISGAQVMKTGVIVRDRFACKTN